MAKKPSKTAAVAPTVALLAIATIVAAGADGMLAVPESFAPLLAEGLVETNPNATPNEAGEVPVRATQKGIESTMTQATNTPAAVSSGFVIEDGIAMPSGTVRRAGAQLYPFDALQVGQSFFVPNSEDKPNAAKSLASTVSSANARYAVETGETKTNSKGETVPVTKLTRVFVVRKDTRDGVEGARVWRMADNS